MCAILLNFRELNKGIFSFYLFQLPQEKIKSIFNIKYEIIEPFLFIRIFAPSYFQFLITKYV